MEEINIRLGHELLTSNQEKAKLEEQLFKVEKRKASQEELLLVVQKRIHELERGQKTKICNPATASSTWMYQGEVFGKLFDTQIHL